MKKFALISAVVCAAFIISSCAGVIGFRKPGSQRVAATKGEQKSLSPVLFDDFESGSLDGSYSYANTAGSASMTKFSISSDEKYSGNYSAVAEFDTGISSEWGCGGAVMKNGGIDAAGRRMLTAWVNAPEGKTFYFFVNETGGNGADGEYWNSASQTGAGKWAYYEVPFDEFFKNIYSGNQAGNNDIDASGIGNVGVQFGGNQGKGRVYLDDIIMK